MKRLFLFVWLALACGIGLVTQASEFPQAFSNWTQTNDLVLITTTAVKTNLTGSAVPVEMFSQHTIHILAATNTYSVTIDSSLDGSNWIGVSTNTTINGTNAWTTQVSLTGHYAYLRARTSGTNEAVEVLWMGGK